MASVFKRKKDKKKKGSQWIASYFDAETDSWKQQIAYTDRGLSLALAQRLEHESGLRREGFTSNVRDESLRPIKDQLSEYITHLASKKRDENYIAQAEARIVRVLDAIKASRLLDVEAGKVETALLTMRTKRGFEKEGGPLSVTTRNEYLNSVSGFTRWAKKRRKLEHDPLECLSQADEHDADLVHPRRALSVDEISKWLDGALRRPEIEKLTIRTGKNKGQLGAKVRDHILVAARRTGRNRRMAYLTAVWTGLRRTELQKLEWRDVVLGSDLPHFQLREEVTKSRRADMLPMHPQLAEELLAFRPIDAKPTDRVLPEVPDTVVIQRDLAFAGIEYGNREIGFADLHAQRKTLNTMLAAQAVAPRVRQAQLRHTDPRLTEGTYFDRVEFLRPQAESIARAAPIPTMSPPADVPKTIADDTRDGALFSQLVHNGGVSDGLLEAQAGTEAEREIGEPAAPPLDEKVEKKAGFGTKWHDPASCDAGPEGKRVTRIELATFTLAT